MSWETDLSPIDYLKRRIIYYRKKRGNVRNMHKDEYWLQQYGLKRVKEIQKLAIERIEKRIGEYEKAIKKLTP
jgi:hypothetical protein